MRRRIIQYIESASARPQWPKKFRGFWELGLGLGVADFLVIGLEDFNHVKLTSTSVIAKGAAN